ncbi:MAG: methyltransferase domain-containing protein [Leptospiraceae bacterium]|nr:methyltransferase domain-containing protein [Leptospiraceae bacterium]
MAKNKKELGSIFQEGVEQWIDKRLVRPSSIFHEMEMLAEKEFIPILSPQAGAVLAFLVKTAKPNNVLELGTGLGYSIAWMVSTGLELNITTVDRNETSIERAKTYLTKIQNQTKIDYINGDCLEFVQDSNRNSEYDFVFVDCDKVTYPEILMKLISSMKKNSILVFDNVLWHGRLNPEIHTRPSDKAIHEFWNYIDSLTNERILFPAGDGILQIVL